MLKGAWILPVGMLVALLLAAFVPAEVFAAGQDEFRKPAPTYFKNLPGVIPEAEKVQKDDYDCTSDIEDVYRSRGGYRILNGDVMPTRLYHCTTESGVTFTGTQMPNTQWVPGLNPHHLPK